MTPLLEQKLVGVIEQLQHGAAEAAGAAKMALPQLASVVLRTVQWDGAWHILCGFALLIAVAVCVKSGKAAYRHINGDDYDPDDDIVAVPVCVLLIVGGAICLVEAFVQLFNLWHWCAVFDPTAAVAHRIYEALMNKAGG